jgi:hypothetical protein
LLRLSGSQRDNLRLYRNASSDFDSEYSFKRLQLSCARKLESRQQLFERILLADELNRCLGPNGGGAGEY